MSNVRLNIGCGGRPLAGYINVDQDDLEALKKRYPGQNFPEGVRVESYDIFNLPFENDSVDEIRCDALIEHLSFSEEPLFFYEIKRVLKKGGLFRFSTPHFEKMIRLWLDAKDDWKDFYRSDDQAIQECHWFGTYSYGFENRWGYLMASIFGPQNGAGQFHKNAYTPGKIEAILNKLNFKINSLTETRWKGDRDFMIEVEATKN